MDTEITETTVEDAAEATLKKEKRKKYILLTLKVLFLVYFLKYLWKIIVNLCAICWYSLVICWRTIALLDSSKLDVSSKKAEIARKKAWGEHVSEWDYIELSRMQAFSCCSLMQQEG